MYFVLHRITLFKKQCAGCSTDTSQRAGAAPGEARTVIFQSRHRDRWTGHLFASRGTPPESTSRQRRRRGGDRRCKTSVCQENNKWSFIIIFILFILFFCCCFFFKLDVHACRCLVFDVFGDKHLQGIQFCRKDAKGHLLKLPPIKMFFIDVYCYYCTPMCFVLDRA